MKKIIDLAINLAISVIAMLVTVGALELSILVLFWFPDLNRILPENLRYYPIMIYTYLDRQLTREMALWDKDLTYILKPNAIMEHRNREFDVIIKTNKIGVRDDDESLDKPDVIVIGDSFAMGFGVPQDETFPQVIEHQTGLKVLNTGIESYGTAREVMMLDRLDTENLKYLVVQYCPNDLEENYSFNTNNGKLKTMDRADFDSTLKGYLDDRKYYFGKYLLFMARNMKKKAVSFTSNEEKKIYNRAHAEMFLDALARIRADMDQVQVIAFDLVDKNYSYILQHDLLYDSKLFTDLVQTMSRDARYPEYIRKMSIFNASGLIGDNERFILDGHVNAEGHAILAQKIMRMMK